MTPENQTPEISEAARNAANGDITNQHYEIHLSIGVRARPIGEITQRVIDEATADLRHKLNEANATIAMIDENYGRQAREFIETIKEKDAARAEVFLLRDLLKENVRYLGKEIERLPLNESAASGVQAISKRASEMLDKTSADYAHKVVVDEEELVHLNYFTVKWNECKDDARILDWIVDHTVRSNIADEQTICFRLPILDDDLRKSVLKAIANENAEKLKMLPDNGVKVGEL